MCEPMVKSDQPTTIEKYANRRLYNTGTGTDVTLEDLAAMQEEGEDFRVYDAKTGRDITPQCGRRSSSNRKTRRGGTHSCGS